jgi:thiaminase/transcriptional activator TenA
MNALSTRPEQLQLSPGFPALLGQPHIERTYWRGQTIYRREDSATHIYSVTSGRVKRAFAQAYALALARSDEPDTIGVFHDLIGGLREELKLHAAYAAGLGIDVQRVAPNRACQAYVDFLLHTAWHSSLGETLAAMTPCMRLYAYLGSELAGRLADSAQEHPYRRWIAAYSGQEFHDLASNLEALLDRFGADTPRLRDAYRYAMRCELDFFTSALGETA